MHPHLRSESARILQNAFLVVLVLTCCERTQAKPLAEREAGTRAPTALEVTERVYDQGLAAGWLDYGWSPRALAKDHPALIDFSNHGGWIVAHPGLSGHFGGLTYRIQAPAPYGDFLQVRVESATANLFPSISVGPSDRVDLADGGSEVWLPLSRLDPQGLPFDRIVFRAIRPVGSEKVALDRIGFTREVKPAPIVGGSGVPSHPAEMRIDCAAASHRVSPMIYGIAFDPSRDAKSDEQWSLGATARRWGGNTASTYNWELGNAWSTGSDWYFHNVDMSPRPHYTYRTFLDDDVVHGLSSALTVPIMGWVARDTHSASFPVSLFGPQQKTDPWLEGAGNGLSPGGAKLPPRAPTLSAIPSTPDSIARWIRAIGQEDAKRGLHSVSMYILDNEPMLWDSTHRDLHPEPVGYDELLARTLAYGAAIRRADPKAVIAGPALWGWPAYQYSAIDAASGFRLHPDRRAHGEVPFLAWYLRELRAHEKETGLHLLDRVDVHFYPQGEGVGSAAADPATRARRLRSTRALWDPGYVDESWIKEPIALIPRLRKWIAENDPGVGISIGEYNFGAEQDLSGGLAEAQALGIFAQQGIDSAFYWTYPPRDSPVYWAFRAYRNFDGHGRRFLDWSVAARPAPGTSLYVSRDAAGSHLVAIALNLDPDAAAEARIDLSSCGEVSTRQSFSFTGAAEGFRAEPVVKGTAGPLMATLPPYSITVLDITLARPFLAHE